MLKLLRIFPAWLPATSMMLAIFAFSSIPSTSMPHFSWADLLIKKGGHLLGYGLLALAFFWWFSEMGFFQSHIMLAAWGFATLYAMTDEFHQYFIAGRYASWVDVVIDATGAALLLFFLRKYLE